MVEALAKLLQLVNHNQLEEAYLVQLNKQMLELLDYLQLKSHQVLVEVCLELLVGPSQQVVVVSLEQQLLLLQINQLLQLKVIKVRQQQVDYLEVAQSQQDQLKQHQHQVYLELNQLQVHQHQLQQVSLEGLPPNQKVLKQQEEYLAGLQQNLMQISQQVGVHYLVELSLLEEYSDKLVPQLPLLAQQMLSHLLMVFKTSLIK